MKAGALERVYRSERARLTRAAARLVGDDRAQDVLQDAFVAYAKHADEVAVPEAWLTTVTRNRALEDLRRKEAPLPDDLPSTAATPVVEQAATAEVVAAALGDLDERSRTALRLRFYDEQPYEQLATELGVSVAQAHVIVHRSIRRLGRALVRQLASAHRAGDCVPALESLLGLREIDDEHADCGRCAPVLDELAALRGFGVLPLPASLFVLVRRAFGEASRAAPVVEPAMHLAPALAAFALVIASLAPAAPAPAAAEPVSPPSPATARATVGDETAVARAHPSASSGSGAAAMPAPGPEKVAEVGDDVIIAEDDEQRQGIVDGEVAVAGVVLCRPLDPCPRMPEERGDR